MRDYDEAIAFYVDVLNFDLVADEYQPEQGTRWVVVRPKGDGAAGLVLTRASNDHQAELIGDQAGEFVFLFLRTEIFGAITCRTENVVSNLCKIPLHKFSGQ